MADILLSALPSNMTVQSVPISTSATATQPQLPPEIANLPKGSTLEGFVINRDAHGNPILRTTQGDVLIKSDLFLKTGSQIVLRLTQQSGQTNAKIISIDQQSVQQFAQHQAAVRSEGVQATREGALQSSASLQAVLLSPARFGSEQQTQQTIASILRLPIAQLPPLSEGLSLQFKLITPQTVQPPPAQTSPAPPPPAAPQAPTATPTATATATTQAHYGAYSKTSPPAPSTAASAPPPQPSNTAAPAQNATLTATVIGHEGTESIVRSAIGNIKLFTPAPLTTGSQITLEYVPLPAGTLTQASTPASTPAQVQAQAQTANITLASQLSADWDSLHEAMQLLGQGAAASGAQPTASDLAARIPNTKSELVNSVLFFMSALRGNDVQKWLGQQNSSKIESKSPSLLQRLTGDFSALSVVATPDKPDLPWQMLAFPLMHEDALHQARLFWRHEDSQSGAQGEDETRFIFDLELTALGPLQIDGLVHGTRPHCRCDLVIRSQQTLPETMHSELTLLYQDACEAAGLAGQLRFSAGKSQMLTPLQELREAAAHGDVGSILA